MGSYSLTARCGVHSILLKAVSLSWHRLAAVPPSWPYILQRRSLLQGETALYRHIVFLCSIVVALLSTASAARDRGRHGELRLGRQAVRRRGLGIRGRLLQPDGTRDRRREPDHHGLRAETVTPGGAIWPRLCRQPKLPPPWPENSTYGDWAGRQGFEGQVRGTLGNIPDGSETRSSFMSQLGRYRNAMSALCLLFPR